jgi:chemotaxis protein histidine kinase CheA
MIQLKKTVLGISIGLLTSCTSVPKQVVDAVQLQQKEIERVKTIYFENMNNQLDAIEKYRYFILDTYENQLIAKKATTASIETKDNKPKSVEIEPTGDKGLDHINIAHLETIYNFFRKERENVRNDMQHRREQINLINRNFENIEQLNNALDDYMQSIKRLSNSQDKLAQSLQSTIQKITPIPFSLVSLPDPKTIEDIFNTLNK